MVTFDSELLHVPGWCMPAQLRAESLKAVEENMNGGYFKNQRT